MYLSFYFYTQNLKTHNYLLLKQFSFYLHAMAGLAADGVRPHLSGAVDARVGLLDLREGRGVEEARVGEDEDGGAEADAGEHVVVDPEEPHAVPVPHMVLGHVPRRAGEGLVWQHQNNTCII